MRTRNRCYDESSQSSSSSNIAYADRSSLKQFDQQEGKRQKRTGKRQKRTRKRQIQTKEKSFFTFDMACYEDGYLLCETDNHTQFVNMLEVVCNGEDCSLEKFSDPHFWQKFACQLRFKTCLPEKNCNADLCKEFCDRLKSTYQAIKRDPINPHGCNATLPGAYKKQLFRIFGGKTPSTSTRKSSRRSLFSLSSDGNPSRRAGGGLEHEVHTALAELISYNKLEFDDVEIAHDIISKSETRSKVFLKLSFARRAEEVDKGLKKRKTEKLFSRN